jgi:hypothetical protein
VLSIYSEFIGFNENTPRIGLQVHSKVFGAMMMVMMMMMMMNKER